MRSSLKLGLTVAAMSILLSAAGARADDDHGYNHIPPSNSVPMPDQDTGKCHLNYDKNGTQFKVCDKTVEVGGEIKDVDWEHPAGKGKAFIPQAGRDAERVVSNAGHNIENGAQAVGKGAEHVTQEAGKVLQRIFGW